MSCEPEAFECPPPEVLASWLDGERPAPASWPEHAATCERCGSLVSDHLRVTRLLAPLRRTGSTSGSLAALRRKLADRALPPAGPGAPRVLALPRLAGAAAAALGFLGIHVLLGDVARGSGPPPRLPADDPIALYHALAAGPGPLERLLASPEPRLLTSLSSPNLSPPSEEPR